MITKKFRNFHVSGLKRFPSVYKEDRRQPCGNSGTFHFRCSLCHDSPDSHRPDRDMTRDIRIRSVPCRARRKGMRDGLRKEPRHPYCRKDALSLPKRKGSNLPVNFGKMGNTVIYFRNALLQDILVSKSALGIPAHDRVILD